MRLARTVAVLTAVVVAVAACNAEDPAPSDPSPQATPPPASTNPPTPQSTKGKPASKPGEKQQARLDEQLIDAAWDNDLRRARSLIARGADVNAKDNTVQSAYLISTSEGYLELSPRTSLRSPGCWSIWALTLMRWMTSTTRRGWSLV
jgi:uncharacterized protein